MRELSLILPDRRLARQPQRHRLAGSGVRRANPAAAVKAAARCCAARSPVPPWKSPAARPARSRWPVSSPRSRTSTASPGSGRILRTLRHRRARLGRRRRSRRGRRQSDCRTRDFIAQFSIVVAFDAAPVPVAAAASGRPVAAEATESSSTESAESSEGEGAEMKLKLSGTNRVIVAMLVVVLLAIAFWMLLLSPKREEADKLGAEVATLQGSLAVHEAEAEQAEEARKEFPANYQQLVVLGKAVPGDDDTASLLVQVNRIAEGADVTFRDLTLEAATSAEPRRCRPRAPEAPAGGPTATPTEVAASTLPLGATIGPAGLCRDALHAHLRRRLLRGRRLHQGPRLAGRDRKREGRRQRAPASRSTASRSKRRRTAASRRWKRPSRSPPT